MEASDPVETNFPLLQQGGRPHMDPGSGAGVTVFGTGNAGTATCSNVIPAKDFA